MKQYILPRRGSCLGFDFDVDAGCYWEDFEFVDGVGGGIEDVEDADVRAHFKLLAGFSIDVW